MLGPENVFLSTKANLATSQDATLLPTHFYDYDYWFTTVLATATRMTTTTIGFVTILLLYYLIFSLIASLLWRSYHKYPCQLSLFQADCNLEDDFQFSSNFHTFRFPSSCISSIINSHFQGWTCWAFAKTPGTARMIVGNNSAKAARKGKELTSSWGPSLLAGGWGPPPVKGSDGAINRYSFPSRVSWLVMT